MKINYTYVLFFRLDLFNETNKKPKTELELLQEQRDLKRRRAAYRGKRVHTDRKSYTEVGLCSHINSFYNNYYLSDDLGFKRSS